MKKTLFVGILFLGSSCLPLSQCSKTSKKTLLPVRLSSSTELSPSIDPNNLATEMLRDLRPNGEEGLEMGNKIAHNCQEYLQFKQQGLRAGETTFARTQEGLFKTTCAILQFIKESRPSKESFLGNYQFTLDSLKDLPPCLGGMGGDSSYSDALKKAMQSGSSWAAFEPTKKIIEIDKDRMVFKDVREKIYVHFVAWGDFDHNGVEDVLVQVATYPIQGSYRAYESVVLTRKKGENLFRVVKSLDSLTSFCEPTINRTFSACSWDTFDKEKGKFNSLFSSHKYTQAYAFLKQLKKKCYPSLSEERQLWLLSDLSLAALKAGNKAQCLQWIEEATTLGAYSWSKAAEALKHNKNLCK